MAKRLATKPKISKCKIILIDRFDDETREEVAFLCGVEPSKVVVWWVALHGRHCMEIERDHEYKRVYEGQYLIVPEGGEIITLNKDTFDRFFIEIDENSQS